jgi:hypothetical protein
MNIYWLAIKRIWCWIVGHKRHELLWTDELGLWNTHMCERCLMFWREGRETK